MTATIGHRDAAMTDSVIRVGVLTPHAAIGPEAELPTMVLGNEGYAAPSD